MKTPVDVTFTNPVRCSFHLAAAISYRKLPEGWRESEYAMTKANALRSQRTILEQFSRGPVVRLDLFDWSVLLGELARYHLATRDDGVLDAFQDIRVGIDANPDACRKMKRAREYHAKVRKLQKLETEVDALKQQMRKEEMDASLFLRLAGFPCGGCRQPSCDHCRYELGLDAPDGS
jgi:hypothetical protein